MKSSEGARRDGGLFKIVFIAAAGIRLSCGEASAVANYNQIVDSSVGKEPALVMASAVGAINAMTAWDNLRRSFQGKPASVVLFEGPPPRNGASQRAEFNEAGYFYLYADNHSSANHFMPIGYMGDRQDIRVDENSTEDPADGQTCMKIAYRPSGRGGQGWAGLYWLDPKSNWRGIKGGYNLAGMTRLTFWARGAKGGEQIAVFKVGGIGDSRSQRGSASIGPVWLTRDWQHYVIDLADADLSRVTGAFAWSSDGSDNIGPLVFYLDEIRYER